MIECPRCNKQMIRITKNHTQACDKTPKPKELARLWLDSPTLTTKHLARLFDVHPDFLAIQLKLGGIPKRNQRKRGYLIRRMNWGRTKKEQPTVSQNYKTCNRCGVIINANQNLCQFCKKEGYQYDTQRQFAYSI